MRDGNRRAKFKPEATFPGLRTLYAWMLFRAVNANPPHLRPTGAPLVRRRSARWLIRPHPY